ncbi:sialate O-acetylesterase [Sphingomonas sp.]|jgi:hypothetical protein|uniref:sialate O-acetylesterase n=1 Tax=Sphingomonas sp. TaxID=28214 RepID=UPI0026047EF9|nr:sialate O-acetylesterase [Sphingomonas sp.]MDF2603023.1 hypothetical protein [Sphingomonas sp.]
MSRTRAFTIAVLSLSILCSVVAVAAIQRGWFGREAGPGGPVHKTPPAPVAKAQIPVADRDVIIHVVWGQSLSVGSGSLPVISTDQVYNNLSGPLGPRTEPDQWVAFEPLREFDYDKRGETIASAFANGLSRREIDLLGVPDNATQAHLVFAPGTGNLPLSELRRGSKRYDQYFLRSLRKIIDIAVSEGKTVGFGSILWMQGEHEAKYKPDMTQAEYRDSLISLRREMEADIKRLLSEKGIQQKEVVPLLTSQANRTRLNSGAGWRIAQAQLEASRVDPNIYFVSPTYDTTPHDGTHLTAQAEFRLGDRFAEVYHWLQRGYEVYDAVIPVAAWIEGDTLTCKFLAPVLPLQWNFDVVSGAKWLTDYGFRLEADGKAVGIDSVPTIHPDGDKLTWKVPADLRGSLQLRGGMDYFTPGAGFAGGSYGILSDSSERTIEIPGRGQEKLRSMMAHFAIPVTRGRPQE